MRHNQGVEYWNLIFQFDIVNAWNICGTYWCYSGEITNKMQPCNRIYYSTVHWRLNMFRAAHRSSYGRPPHAYVNQRLQIQLGLLMMSGVPLETCWAFNECWNNKFYYKVASCWLFLLSHTTMHGSMNIKKKNGFDVCCFHNVFNYQS
jgi:hypothetical protein